MSQSVGEGAFCSFLLKKYININYIQLINCTIEFSYVLVDIWPTGAMNLTHLKKKMTHGICTYKGTLKS